ncbi:MAG TPA: zinc-binding alcohol dehydrogenase family protein [Limosilactobacillus coleohominis]|nr:zinc-binding alcohol dehydrogenase family protein [Limosilactobacillus coleohominis]
MHAVVVSQAGGPEVLEYKEVSVPEVKAGWSLIDIKGFGINHSEIFTRRGDSPSVKFPRILGIECVGVIKETTDPDRLPIDQRVVSIMGEMGRAFDGSYAEYVLVPNEQIYPIDSKLDWETLATLPETYYTAFGSIKNMRLKNDDEVLIRAGGSGVGIAALQLIKGKYPEMKVTGTTRHESQVQILKDQGYDEVILDQNNRLQTDRKWSKILELIGATTMKDSFNHLQPGGIICNTGELGGQWYLQEFDPIEALAPDSYLTSFYSGNVNQQRLNELLQYVEKYHISVKPVKVFQLNQLREAHEYLESQHGFGKVIVLE